MPEIHEGCREQPALSKASTAPRKPAAARSRPLPLTSLNHVSIHCSNVEQSVNFYCDVMGFVPVRRPDCLNFDGAWLFNHGIGIHLLGQSEDPHAPQLRVPKEINPKSDHFSFQCDHIEEVESGLEERGIPFLRQCVEEAGIMVEQLFFHDPDGHMIEVCNCDLLPVVPLRPDPDMPLALPACVRRKPQACGRKPPLHLAYRPVNHIAPRFLASPPIPQPQFLRHACRIHVGLRPPPAMHPSAFTALSRREVGRAPLFGQRARVCSPLGAPDPPPLLPGVSASANPRAPYCPRALPGYLSARAWASLQPAAHDCYDYALSSSASAMQARSTHCANRPAHLLTARTPYALLPTPAHLTSFPHTYLPFLISLSPRFLRFPLSPPQVDPSEQRYLLVGSAAGAITAFDTAAPTAVDAFAHPCHPPLFTLPRAPSSASHASAHAARSLADASAPSAAGEAHSLAVRGVAWYPVDPGLFVSASLDGLVKLWDTNTLQALLSFHMPGRVGDVAMSHAQGAPLLAAAACEDGNVRLCDLASGAATHMLRASQGAITRLCWSPVSPFHLASGSSAGAIRIWDIRRPAPLHSLHHRHSQPALRPPLLPRVLSPPPACRAAAQREGGAEATGGRGVKVSRGQRGLRGAADERVGGVGSGGRGVGDGGGLGRKRGREESVGAGRKGACERGRAARAVGNAREKQGKAGRSEEKDQHGCKTGFVGWWGGRAGVRVRIGQTGRWQGEWGRGGAVQQRQWGEEAGQVAHEGAVLSMAPTRNGLFLLSYGSDQRLRLWDVEAGTNTLIHYANQRAPRGALASEATVRFCMSHDGSLVFLPQGPAIQVFHTWTGESLASLHAHFDNVLLCCSHPTLPQLFSSGADRQLLSWTSPLLDQLHSPQSHSPTSRSRAFVRYIQQGPLPDEDAWSD
ncbi:unnamed protein product [Closterium sp. NIES-53]